MVLQPVAMKNKLALGIGFFAMFFANQSIAVLAIPFYQMTLGVDPFLLGLALTIPVVVSTLLGPWVGHWSDNFTSRFGRRRPFIFVGAWLSCLTFGAIWMVSPQWSQAIQLGYFVVCSLLFNCFVIVLSVPLTCLSYEMSDDHHQRTEIMGFTSYFIKIGSLLYQWLFPLSQLAIFGGLFVGIKYIGWGVGIVIIGFLGCLPSIFCHENLSNQQAKLNHNKQPKKSLSLLRSLATLKNNKALFVLLLLTALQLCGGAFTASMDYYLVVYYQHSGDVAEGSIWKGVLSTAYAAFGLLTIPLIAKLSSRYGKVKALTAIYWLTAVGGVFKWFIFTPDVRWLLVLDAVFCTAVWTAMTMLIPSMLADLCDEDEVLHQQRREGLFVSLHSWVVNFSMAAALLLSGLTLNLIGFSAEHATGQTAESLLSMRVILSLGTVFFSLLPLYFLRFYHLDANKSLAIKNSLAKKRYQSV